MARIFLIARLLWAPWDVGNNASECAFKDNNNNNNNNKNIIK